MLLYIDIIASFLVAIISIKCDITYGVGICRRGILMKSSSEVK